MKLNTVVSLSASALLIGALIGCDSTANGKSSNDDYKIQGALFNEQTEMYTYKCLHSEPTYAKSLDSTFASGWYPDIKPGMGIIVRDAENRIVSSGALGRRQEYSKGCYYEFELKVPAGGDFYTVELGRRGDFFYTEEELKTGDLEITLTID